eukprot:48342-Chlamydomonas_euryale.AAC.1
MPSRGCRHVSRGWFVMSAARVTAEAIGEMAGRRRLAQAFLLACWDPFPLSGGCFGGAWPSVGVQITSCDALPGRPGGFGIWVLWGFMGPGGGSGRGPDSGAWGFRDPGDVWVQGSGRGTPAIQTNFTHLFIQTSTEPVHNPGCNKAKPRALAAGSRPSPSASRNTLRIFNIQSSESRTQNSGFRINLSP